LSSIDEEISIRSSWTNEEISIRSSWTNEVLRKAYQKSEIEEASKEKLKKEILKNMAYI
jgi:hypothetical protein